MYRKRSKGVNGKHKRHPSRAKQSSVAPCVDMKTLARNLAQEARLAYCERRKRLKKTRIDGERKRERDEQFFQAQGGMPVIVCFLNNLIERLECQEKEERLRVLKAIESDRKATVHRLAVQMEHSRLDAKDENEEVSNNSRSLIRPFNLSELKSSSPNATKRLEYLIATRGWTLVCSKNHLKYSRRVCTKDGGLTSQMFTTSQSPSDFRARAKALRDVIALETNVVSIF